MVADLTGPHAHMVNHDLRGGCADANQGVAEKRVHRELENALVEDNLVARERVVMQRFADIAAVEYGHQRSGNPASFHGAGDAHAVIAEMRDDHIGVLQFARKGDVDSGRELIPEPARPSPEHRAKAPQSAPPADDLAR
ncbi:MAG: hypothetical protein E5W81_06770 [Mesorhizobium sp.]|nr:MAG: hypothetical protein E5W81_06770 [Mesorhizobium sp.]